MSFGLPDVAQRSPEFPDSLKKQIVLRKIAPYQEEWWNYFLKDIEPRGITAVELDEYTCLLNYGKRRRIHLETKIQGDDLWLYPRLQNHPVFLAAIFISFGASVALLMGIFYLIFGAYFLTSPLWFILIFYIICFASFLIGSVLRGKGHLNPWMAMPDYTKILLDVYEAARHAEKRILEQYSLQDQAPTQSQSFCPRCGKPIEPTWTACPFCGISLAIEFTER